MKRNRRQRRIRRGIPPRRRGDAEGNGPGPGARGRVRRSPVSAQRMRSRKRRSLHRGREALLEVILSKPSQFSVWALDNSYRYIYFNETHAALMRRFWNAEIRLGEEVLSCIDNQAYRETTEGRYEAVLAGETVSDESAISDRDGQVRTFHTLLSPIEGKRIGLRSRGIAAFSVETTQLRRQQQALRLAEEDKTSLLQELDHRVKNNLQTIMSLLRIQMDTLPGDHRRSVLQDAINRVSALGYLYDSLVITEHVSQVALHSYLEMIASSVLQDTRIHRTPRLERDMEELYVPMPAAVALGLIASEFLSARARQDGTGGHESESGRVYMALQRREQDRARLVLETDPGAEAQEEAEDPVTSLIVEALTHQIGGSVHRSGEAGGRRGRIEVDFRL